MTPIETVAACVDAAASPIQKPSKNIFRVSGIHRLRLNKDLSPVLNPGGRRRKKISKNDLSPR